MSSRMHSHSVIKTAFIVIGHKDQLEAAAALKDSLEDSEGGRVAVDDLEKVEKSVGPLFDEKLKRFLARADGIVIICSNALKDCIDDEQSVEVTLNQTTTITLNGKTLKKYLEDDKYKRKFITLASDKELLPKALQGKEMITFPEGNIPDDMLANVVNEIRAILEGFQSE